MRHATAALLVLLTFHVSLLTSEAQAAPSQQDVLRSIQQSVGNESKEGSKGLPILLCAVGGVILMLVVSSRVRSRAPAPRRRTKENPNKLLREVMKSVPLKSKEIKQLKLLAESTRRGEAGERVENPLTLVLCPSVLGRAMKNRPVGVDRAVVGQVVRKMGTVNVGSQK